MIKTETRTPVRGRLNKKEIQKTLLVEVSWESCNQVGGIYTVLRSKVPTQVAKFGDNYCLIGPYVNPNVATEFEEVKEYNDAFGKVVAKMREMGLDVRYGKWLVTGRPNIVLIKSIFCLSIDWEKSNSDFGNITILAHPVMMTC